MKINIIESENKFSKEESKLIYDLFSEMLDYYDDDEEERETLQKFFDCIIIK